MQYIKLHFPSKRFIVSQIIISRGIKVLRIMILRAIKVSRVMLLRTLNESVEIFPTTCHLV